jgi:hypothetical protein
MEDLTPVTQPWCMEAPKGKNHAIPFAFTQGASTSLP